MSYSPNDPPEGLPPELKTYILRELNLLAEIVNRVELGHLEKTFVDPSKPIEGDLRYADGTSWNPGTGIGLYQFRAAVWVKVG